MFSFNTVHILRDVFKKFSVCEGVAGSFGGSLFRSEYIGNISFKIDFGMILVTNLLFKKKIFLASIPLVGSIIFNKYSTLCL